MNILEQYAAVLESLQKLPENPARDRAIERLEESAFWASAHAAKAPSPIAHVNSAPKKSAILFLLGKR